MKTVIQTVISLLLLANGLLAQSIETVTQHADEILSPFSDPTKPGISGALVQHGEIIYLKSQGLANLETGALATTNTMYQIDKMAKQFTAYAFLKLIDMKTVNMSDNIGKYLTDLRPYQQEITIAQVLNHTTGLNNYNTMNMLKGNTPYEPLTNQSAMSLVRAQDESRCQPGTDFSIYDSDTESLLMAEIIANATGMSFPDFVQKHVFDALGLENAVFLSDHQTILNGMAHSYQVIDSVYTLRSNPRDVVGPSNMFISIADISKWYSFFSPKMTDRKYDLVKKLDTPVKNAAAKGYHSSWGAMTYGRSYLHAERGIPKYWQFGLIGSYGINVFRFPEQDITSIAVGNNNQYNGYSAMMMLTPILENEYKSPPNIDETLIDIKDLSLDQLQKWNGDYFNEDNGQVRTIALRDDTLRYVRTSGETKLVPLNENEFQLIGGSDDVIIFSFSEEVNGKSYTYSSGGSDPQRYSTFEAANYTTDQLLEYEGTYINASLGQVYTFQAEGDHLKAIHHKNGELDFIPVKRDVFNSQFFAMLGIHFERKNQQLTGFNIRTVGMNDVRFEKVK